MESFSTYWRDIEGKFDQNEQTRILFKELLDEAILKQLPFLFLNLNTSVLFKKRIGVKQKLYVVETCLLTPVERFNYERSRI